MTTNEELDDAEIIRIPAESSRSTHLLVRSTDKAVHGTRFRVEQHGTMVSVYLWTFDNWAEVFRDKSWFDSLDDVDHLRVSKALVREALFVLFWTP